MFRIHLILEYFLHFVLDVLAIFFGARDESREDEMRKEMLSDGDVLETENGREGAEDFFGDRSLQLRDEVGSPASDPVAIRRSVLIDGVCRDGGRESFLERERRAEEGTASFEYKLG